MAEPFEKFTEGHQCLASLYVLGAAAASENNTGYVSLEGFGGAVIIIHPLDVNDVLDIDIEEAVNTSGGSPQSFHSGDHDTAIQTADTKPTVINVDAAELDVNDGYVAINVEVIAANTAGGGNDYVVEIWGINPSYRPVPTTGLDSVVG